MGVPQKAVAYIKPDEYLALEEKATTKHEYLDGVIYAWQGFVPEFMVGGSLAHNAVCFNVAVALREALRDSGCRVYMADAKLHIDAANAYFYPDIIVTCSPTDRPTIDAQVVREPSLIVEVLSNSTEAFDRGEKFTAYQRITSLNYHLLVSQHGRRIELHARDAHGLWQIRSLTSPARMVDGIKIGTADVSIAIDEIFADVS